MCKEIYLGIDVGSTTGKVVMIDSDEQIYKSSYKKLYAKPVEVVFKMLQEMSISEYEIRGIGVTGSARNLIGNVLQADIIKNEITAHTIGAFYPINSAKTIIEIGGQDSKIIFINEGILDSFAMNKICAAGTGSFLEWQAQRLGLTLCEFNDLAMKSEDPIKLSGKCAVFIESSIVKAQQMGHRIEDIAMGICDTLVHNYISELAVGREITSPIVFQGGVASLGCMVKSFERILKQPVLVPDNCCMVGALGMACLAKKKKQYVDVKKEISIPQSFTNFETSLKHCQDCANCCELSTITYNKQTYISGSRCGKY